LVSSNLAIQQSSWPDGSEDSSMNTSAQQLSAERAQAGDVIHIADPNLRSGFAQVPRPVLRATVLSDKAKLVYTLLLDYAWQQGSCFPGQQRLASDLFTTVRTIRRALEELKRCHFISWKRRGLSQTNVYTILSLGDNPFLGLDEAERTNMSYQKGTPVSHQKWTKMSDKVDSEILDPDEYLRNSKSEIGKRSTEEINPYATPSDAAVSPPRVLPFARTVKSRRSNFTSLAQALTARSSHAKAHREGGVPAVVSDQLRACVTDIAQEFGDSRHLRSNLTQALHLLQQSSISEVVFVSRLYESRAITKDRRTVGLGRATVSKPMAYFWTVVRDEVGIHANREQAMSTLDAPDGLSKQGRGDLDINGQVNG
jgi:Helix-turn-helix domain